MIKKNLFGYLRLISFIILILQSPISFAFIVGEIYPHLVSSYHFIPRHAFPNNKYAVMNINLTVKQVSSEDSELSQYQRAYTHGSLKLLEFNKETGIIKYTLTIFPYIGFTFNNGLIIKNSPPRKIAHILFPNHQSKYIIEGKAEMKDGDWTVTSNKPDEYQLELDGFKQIYIHFVNPLVVRIDLKPDTVTEEETNKAMQDLTDL